MEIKIDVKSLVIGLLLGFILVTTVAAVSFSAQKSEASGSGRFKMILGTQRVYILDSHNGRPWTVPADTRRPNGKRDLFWASKLELYEKELGK